MLIYDFKDYEGFKELFGIIEHGNGVKSRKNKILLSLYKDRNWLKRHVTCLSCDSDTDLYRHFSERVARISDSEEKKNYRKVIRCRQWYDSMSCSCRYNHCHDLDPLSITDMAELKRWVYNLLTSFRSFEACNRLYLNGRKFYSDSYETDDMMGLCEDGTLNAIRYRNIEKDRVYKMKAGKMFNHLLSCNDYTKDLPEQVQRWMGEQFVADWMDYAAEKLSDNSYTLHVDDNFEGIYSTRDCKGYLDHSGSFGSCMAGNDQWQFYRDSVDAKAAYLTDGEDMIVARCIVFTDVKDQDGKTWRLAERQYAYQEDDMLKRQLVSALIREGHIDGYKRVGSSCHDARAYVDNEGNSLGDRDFRIRCVLGYGDTLSYQDSFKYYDMKKRTAYNYCAAGADIQLDTTTPEIEEPENEDDHDDESWSSYNDEWIDNDDACYVETRDDYFHGYQTVCAYVLGHGGRYHEEDCFEDDCVEIDGDYYYAGENACYPEDYGICECPECDEYIVPGHSDTYYSELTEKDYCCEGCRDEAERRWHEDNGEVRSEYDDDWFDEDDVITAQEWCGRHYWDTTISVESFNDLVEEGKATEYNGVYYLDDVMYDGEPAHLGQARNAV